MTTLHFCGGRRNFCCNRSEKAPKPCGDGAFYWGETQRLIKRLVCQVEVCDHLPLFSADGMKEPEHGASCFGFFISCIHKREVIRQLL